MFYSSRFAFCTNFSFDDVPVGNHSLADLSVFNSASRKTQKMMVMMMRREEMSTDIDHTRVKSEAGVLAASPSNATPTLICDDHCSCT